MADDKPKTVAELKAFPKVVKAKPEPTLEERVAALEEEIKKCVHAHS